MQEFNNHICKNNTQSWVAPAVEKTQAKTISKLKQYQKLTMTADDIVAILPAMKTFVHERLTKAANSANFGAKIADGGIGDWLSADRLLNKIANEQSGLQALNLKAKKALSELVKSSERLGLLANDKAYLEGEKICYFAEKELDALKNMLKLTENGLNWLKRKGFSYNLNGETVSANIKRK